MSGSGRAYGVTRLPPRAVDRSSYATDVLGMGGSLTVMSYVPAKNKKLYIAGIDASRKSVLRYAQLFIAFGSIVWSLDMMGSMPFVYEFPIVIEITGDGSTLARYYITNQAGENDILKGSVYAWEEGE